jgi:3-oxoisoapionate decarboxylase
LQPGGPEVPLRLALALLADPGEVIRALAPYAFTCHIKDMAVQEYEAGILISEVPLGEGIIDLKRAVELLRRSRPKVTFSLEMITRDPLRVPCLTERYWATLPERHARYPARTLAHGARISR